MNNLEDPASQRYILLTAALGFTPESPRETGVLVRLSAATTRDDVDVICILIRRSRGAATVRERGLLAEVADQVGDVHPLLDTGDMRPVPLSAGLCRRVLHVANDTAGGVS